MRAPLDFLWAIISDGWATFTTFLSIAPILAIATHKTGDLPVWALWIVGYVALFITAGRVWHKEYRQPGPKIILEYILVKGRDDEFNLENRSSEDAFDVKIQDISRGEDGYACFSPTNVKAGEKSIVKAVIHKNPEGSLIFQSRFAGFILTTANPQDLREALDGTIIPFFIEYRSIHNQWYRSMFTVRFFPHKPEVAVNFVSYRRVFKSFLATFRLSRHDR